MFASADFNQLWGDRVWVSDSSLSGVALHWGTWPMEAIKGAGRWSERWRFRQPEDRQGRGDEEDAAACSASEEEAAGVWRRCHEDSTHTLGARR